MRHINKIVILSAIFALIALGVFTLFVSPPKAKVASFNQWYKTTLSEREIHYSQSGFVDSEFYAAIPMSSDEFVQTIKEIGMTKAVSIANRYFDNRPWWCEEAKSEVFILDRIDQSNHRDYIEGHFDATKQTAYFSYLDH